MSQLLPNRLAYEQLVGPHQVCKCVQVCAVESKVVTACAQVTLVPDMPDEGYACLLGVASGSSDVRSVEYRVRRELGQHREAKAA